MSTEPSRTDQLLSLNRIIVQIAGTGLLSPIAYALQREILLRRENAYWVPVTEATRGFESYALQRGILLRLENPTYWYWAPVEAATHRFEASKHRCRR